MSLALRRVAAAQALRLHPGEEIVEVGRARTVPGTDSANYFPPNTIWALTSERLFVFANEKGTKPQFDQPLVALELGSAVTGARTEPFDDRGVLLVIDASGHPAMVLMDPDDAQVIVDGIDQGVAAASAEAASSANPGASAAASVEPATEFDTADPGVADPALSELHGALVDRDWERARAVLAAAPSPATREWLFTHLHGAELQAVLDQWVATEPESPDALLARGSNSVLLAQQMRRTGISGDAFWGTLRSAERDLFRALELRFDDPVPFTPLIRSGMWLGIPFEELCMRYDESTRRCPELPGAHLATLEALSPLGAGSEEEMFAFARSAARTAAEGSPIHGLVPFAHLVASVSTPLERRRQYLSGERASEIEIFASMSVDNPAWSDRAGGAEITNIFAAVFAAAGDPARARDLLARNSTGRTSRPWSMLPDGDALYRETVAGNG